MFHWPWGPSIFKPDWSTGQMPERSSGTEDGRAKGCVIVFPRGSVFVCFRGRNEKS